MALNARFLLNEHGDLIVLFHNFNENSVLNMITEKKQLAEGGIMGPTVRVQILFPLIKE